MIHVMLTYIVSLGLCGRFRESDTFRHVFENVLRRCMSEGLVGGEGFAIDASVVRADANGQKKPCGWQTRGTIELLVPAIGESPSPHSSCAVLKGKLPAVQLPQCRDFNQAIQASDTRERGMQLDDAVHAVICGIGQRRAKSVAEQLGTLH